MDRHVVESQDISVVALLRQGEPESSEVEFKFKQDGQPVPAKPEFKVKLLGESHETKLASCKMKAPAVPADKPKLLLEYSLIHEKRELNPAEQIWVWPKSAKLKAFEPDGKTPLARFAFKVKQGTKESTAQRASDAGEAEFQLTAGSDFTIVAEAPFVLLSTDDKKPRELVIKAERKFTAAFAAPEMPKDGNTIKQYVNQPSADDGHKGMGNKVLIKVAPSEDLLNPKAEKIAGPGVFVYLTATFSGPDGKPSARLDTASKRELTAGAEITAIKEDAVTKGKYTAKVELKKKGEGTFEVSLGLAGGDTCTLSIGGAEGRSDSTLILQNWRKVSYEVRAPKTLTSLPEVEISGKKHRNLMKTTQDRIAALGDLIYVEYELASGVPFEITPEMKVANMLPGSFIGSAAAEIFQLSDNQSEKLLRAWPRAGGKKPIARFILCESNYYASESDADKNVDVAVPVKAKGSAIPLPKGNWLPVSDYDQQPCIKDFKWVAKVVANPQPIEALFTTTAGENGGTDKKRIVRLEEKLLAPAALDLSWAKPTVGHIPTEITDDHKKAIKAFLTPLVTNANRRKALNKLQFTMTGLEGAERKDARLQNVMAAVKDLLVELAKPFDPHPGLDDAGQPRTGPLAQATHIEVAKSTNISVWVNLPDVAADDPAKLAGEPDATHCPITVIFSYDEHGAGLGTAYLDDLKGDLLVVFKMVGLISCGDVTMHELGHLFGMTPLKTAKDAFAPGVDAVKGVTADDPVWKTGTEKKGHYYTGKGHTGEHCACGLSDEAKLKPTYGPYGATATCIMFGSTTSIDSRRIVRSLCPQCASLMRARDYTAF